MSPTSLHEAYRLTSLRPSHYDRVASLLIAILLLTATCVVFLFVLWLTPPNALPGRDLVVGGVRPIRESDSRQDDELESPQLAELTSSQLLEPVVELSSLLSRDAVAVVAQLKTDSVSATSHVKSDPRSDGPPPTELVPRWERWEIRYEVSSLARYAQQLDFFGIELGAAGGKRAIDYASHFSGPTPTVRTGDGSHEKRLYLTWRGGAVKQFDRTLLQRAGIDVDRRVLMQFYPPEIEDVLARLEIQHARDGRVDRLRKTVFGVQIINGGYEYFVVEQR